VSGHIAQTKDNVMKTLLFAAAAATLVITAAPVFASPANDAEWDITPYPLAAPCHFVRAPVTLPNGRVVYREVQFCT
jgi:hypothetical protein